MTGGNDFPEFSLHAYPPAPPLDLVETLHGRRVADPLAASRTAGLAADQLAFFAHYLDLSR